MWSARSSPVDLVVVHAFPARLPSTAWASNNLFAQGKNVGWMIEGDPHRGYRLIYDENANGDLRDDQYRVDRLPTYFLVGADGKLALPRGKLDPMIAYLDAHDTPAHGPK